MSGTAKKLDLSVRIQFGTDFTTDEMRSIELAARSAAAKVGRRRIRDREHEERWGPVRHRLGVDSDVSIAADLGVTASRVAQHRNKLGIKSAVASRLSTKYGDE